MKTKPLGDRIIIKVKDEQKEEKTLASGIIVPVTSTKENTQKGTVVAVGIGKYENGNLIPMQTKIGDEVIFGKYGYEEIKIDDEKYIILSESSVFAINQ
jgi:chaperonin GroES